MFVSVIVPNYNHAPFLEQRITSILNQTYKDFELIILDDCSTDDSKTVIEKFRNDPRVSHIVYNVQNAGNPFIQWEKGINLAKADYIWIAESDDYAAETFLENIMPCFQAHPAAALAYSDSNKVDQHKNIFEDYYKQYRNAFFKTDKWNQSYYQSGVEEIKECLLYDCTINNTSACVFKKSIWEKINKEQLRKFRYAGDWFFFLNLVLNGDICYVSTPLNFYRHASDNFNKKAKSAHNLYKEKLWCRFFLWKRMAPAMDQHTRKRNLLNLGLEYRNILSAFLRRETSLSLFLRDNYTFLKSAPALFFKMFFAAFFFHKKD